MISEWSYSKDNAIFETLNPKNLFRDQQPWSNKWSSLKPISTLRSQIPKNAIFKIIGQNTYIWTPMRQKVTLINFDLPQVLENTMWPLRGQSTKEMYSFEILDLWGQKRHLEILISQRLFRAEDNKWTARDQVLKQCYFWMPWPKKKLFRHPWSQKWHLEILTSQRS